MRARLRTFRKAFRNLIGTNINPVDNALTLKTAYMQENFGEDLLSALLLLVHEIVIITVIRITYGNDHDSWARNSAAAAQ